MTVFLSLSLGLLLSLILALVEGARLNAIRLQSHIATDIGMNSVLAEYHRELFEQFDLLFVDASYGSATPSMANPEEHMRRYMQKNFTAAPATFSRDFLCLSADEIEFDRFSIATDDGAKVMKRQIVALMKQVSIEGLAAKLLSGMETVNGMGLDTRNLEEERNAVQAQIDSTELPKKETEDGELVDIPLDNPADAVNATRSMGVLSLTVRDPGTLSHTRAPVEEYVSHRQCNRGTGLHPQWEAPSGVADELLVLQYLYKKFGSYTHPLEKSMLKYQLEYILAGEDTDWKNLERAAARLLRWREVANYIYLLSDAGKCAQAQALALTLTVVLQIPALVQPVKYAILFAWAYIESLQDVRILLNGGKIPLLKTGADWRTSVERLLGFGGQAPEADNGSEGLSYEDYLRIMICMEDSSLRLFRAMDLMEMDIRKTPGNSAFRLDWCFDSFQAEVSVSSRFGHSVRMADSYGYE